MASTSPRRYDLLRSLGLAVDVLRSGYDEPPLTDVTPAELASRHADEKLRFALRNGAATFGAPVLAADTVVDLDGIALGKPADAAEAARMLERLSGRMHAVHTAFALALPGAAQAAVAERETTRVRFFELKPDEIAEYVATGEPLDKAGAYGIQGRAASLVAGIDGDFYTVMGLPLARVIRALRRSGFALPKPNECSPFLPTETNADSSR
ncbi:MAG TPA: Maf family protein [Candidatus Cybelea sp.]|nr:Maf family protein [Candidatus Cybelea sp.]